MGDEMCMHHYEPVLSGISCHHPRTKEFIQCAFCQQSDADTVLGL